MNFLNKLQNTTAAYHVLRISLALLMLAHGVSKLMNGVGGIEGMLAGGGMPQFLVYGVYIGEVVAPLMVLFGAFVAPAALVMAFNMVIAVLLAHTSQVFTLGKSGGWALELQGFYFISAIVVALMAPPSKTLQRWFGGTASKR